MTVNQDQVSSEGLEFLSDGQVRPDLPTGTSSEVLLDEADVNRIFAGDVSAPVAPQPLARIAVAKKRGPSQSTLKEAGFTRPGAVSAGKTWTARERQGHEEKLRDQYWASVSNQISVRGLAHMFAVILFALVTSVTFLVTFWGSPRGTQETVAAPMLDSETIAPSPIDAPPAVRPALPVAMPYQTVFIAAPMAIEAPQPIIPSSVPPLDSRDDNLCPEEGRADACWHEVKSGDWLSKLAVRYYGDITLWRAIAGFNVIAPRELRVGQRIYIPPQPGAAKMAEFPRNSEKSASLNIGDDDAFTHGRATIANADSEECKNLSSSVVAVTGRVELRLYGCSKPTVAYPCMLFSPSNRLVVRERCWYGKPTPS